MSTVPDMLFHMGGVPVANALYANPWSTPYFVDGDHGTAGALADSPESAVTTVTLALAQASDGDVIYVRQRAPATDATDPTAYAENLVIPYAKYGMSIVGTGNNPHNPFYTQIKANAAGYGVKIQAPSTTIENIDFNKGSATTGVIYFSGDVNTTDMGWGCLISNCHIRNASSAANAAVMMYGGSYNTLHNIDFEACHTGVVIQSGGTYPIRSLRIQDCRFKGSNASAVAGTNIKDIGASCIVYELEVLRCYFERLPTGKFVNLTANTYGIIANCYWGEGDADCGTSGADINVPTSVFVIGSWDATAQTATT